MTGPNLKKNKSILFQNSLLIHDVISFGLLILCTGPNQEIAVKQPTKI